MNAKRISRRAAEQMLGGGSAGHQGPLADLLAAAAAPGRTEELVGEAKAVSAFQEAFTDGPKIDLGSAAQRRGAHGGVKSSSLSAVLGRRKARAWSIRVFGTVLVVGAVGGVAIASNGVSGRNPASAPKTPTPTMTAPHLTRKQAPTPVPHATAPPSLVELCRALIDGKPRKQLDPFIKAADGKQKALALCKALVSGQPVQWPEDWPNMKNWSDGLPTAWPTWPQNWPEDWPNGTRTDHPKKPKHGKPHKDEPLWQVTPRPGAED
ncbi:hypothetical protein EDD29_0748 [Actinocorallia herbida]|uniref:Uncharacterized protein n=1 Tax=Actinocorallia herbida TaxID=58109 RepID=A0A3N1CPQ2_9ACTN|nr:hypothetical protein [Actinocorallia herbida]ROO83253.1 hypothetical protein EDD29_0748 [Actinocorallia herbida]